MFWALKKPGKTCVLTSEILNFEFPINVLEADSLLEGADVVSDKSNVKQLYFSKQQNACSI